MTGWQRTERWLALLSFIAAVAALIGWCGAIVTGAGGLAVLLLLLNLATTLFALLWVMRPGVLRWWSGVLLLVVVVGPACYAFVILSGPIAHVAGLFTLVAIAVAGMTVVRRYEMPPVGK